MSITKFYNKQTDTFYAYETTFESKEVHSPMRASYLA